MSVIQLIVKNQESLEQEVIYKNGNQKNVHAVIKNQPFKITIELKGANNEVNFHKYNIQGTLVYDNEDTKPVDFVRKSPMEYETTVTENEAGIADRVTIELKLSVLSSQHEDMFFRVKFGLKGCPKKVIGSISEAIKVVSKPAQLKRNKAPRKRKRTANDTLAETLARIESQQKEQQELLGTLFKTISTNGTVSLPLAQMAAATVASSPVTAERPAKRQKTSSSMESQIAETEMKTESDPVSSFESHLMGLINSFNSMPMEQRNETVKNVIRKCSVQSSDKLSEVLDCLWVEGLQKEVGINVETGSPYTGVVENMGTDALDDLDLFYNDFLNPNVLPTFV